MDWSWQKRFAFWLRAAVFFSVRRILPVFRRGKQNNFVKKTWRTTLRMLVCVGQLVTMGTNNLNGIITSFMCMLNGIGDYEMDRLACHGSCVYSVVYCDVKHCHCLWSQNFLLRSEEDWENWQNGYVFSCTEARFHCLRYYLVLFDPCWLVRVGEFSLNPGFGK